MRYYTVAAVPVFTGPCFEFPDIQYYQDFANCEIHTTFDPRYAHKYHYRFEAEEDCADLREYCKRSGIYSWLYWIVRYVDCDD